MTQQTTGNEIKKALNQSILTFLFIGIPVGVSLIVNPEGVLIGNIAIVFIFGSPILWRLIVYSINN